MNCDELKIKLRAGENKGKEREVDNEKRVEL